jgi:serine protease Do
MRWRSPSSSSALSALPTRSAVALALGVVVAMAACADSAQTAEVRQGSELELTLARHQGAAGDGRTRGLGDLEELDRSRRTAIVRAAERVAPAVVSVSVIRREAVQPRTLYEQLFLPPGTERQVAGMGSGFIIHPDGLVVTNEHVVRGAAEVVVTVADGRDFDGRVEGTDEVNDLALIRLVTGGATLPVAPLGRSDDLLIGEWVVAIGNPFGQLLSNTEPTVTAGVISGLGRNIVPGGTDHRGYYLGMIQTDASINPGNSGGPLVNAEGEVIGVNSSIFTRGGGSEGLGFAIPINRARAVVLDLVKEGAVRRPWTGLELEPANPSRTGRSREVRVAAVAPGSPAERAGLRPGMRVESANGYPIRTPLDWEAALLEVRVGDTVEVAVGGDDRRLIPLVPVDLPSLAAQRINALEAFELITLTPAIRSERGLTRDRGALVVGVSDPVRRTLGIREGDVIVGINRYAVDSAEEAADILQRLRRPGVRTVVRMLVERNGREFHAAFYL